MLVTIMVDASWCPTMKVAGYGCWLASQRRRCRYVGQIRRVVSQANVAEQMAVVNAVVASMNQGVTQPGDTVLIRTDCQAAIFLFTERRKPASEDDELTLKAFNQACERYQIQAKFKHIKGHTNNTERASVSNNLCDKFAKEELYKARQHMKLQEIREKHNL